jgi:hypothetical protein
MARRGLWNTKRRQKGFPRNLADLGVASLVDIDSFEYRSSKQHNLNDDVLELLRS